MNNYINFTSNYNPDLQALSSADGYNVAKMNEMFGQVMGNIAAVQSTMTGSLIEVRNFAPGDGSDQTAQIKNFFDSAQEGDVLLFTAGHYKVVKTGWFYTFSGRSVIIKAMPGAILEVSDQGIRIEGSNHVEISGLTLVRSAQAAWSENRTGLNIENSSNVLLQHNDISKFTDGIGVNGSSSQDNPSRNVVIRNNKLHHLGEEAIAVRRHLVFVVIRENDCYRYLGDGILVKGTWHVLIADNFLHTPVLSSDPDYVAFSGGQQVNNMPAVGGGIACNNEGGETGAKNLHIHGNSLIGTAFGVGLIGFEGTFVTFNVFKDIKMTSVISVSFFLSRYNPNGLSNHLFVIQGNLIDTISKPSTTAAIEAKTSTGTEGMDIGIISDNIIIPRGKHWGIIADGHIIVKGNYIAQAGIAMDIANGVIASSNIIEPGFETTNPDRMVSLHNECTFSHNSVAGKGTCIQLRGSNNIITGNRLKYEGTWWAVHLDIVNNTVEGNIIRDNLLMVTASATGRYLFGASPTTNGKNILVDILKDNNGTLYQSVNEIVMLGLNSERWRITIDAKGNLKTTKL
ncbi:right-handed parallel beta-helix repeat-containing protein [Paenibacillus sp. ClWae2A]|uniref:right-handed parallel beta-helix repeat-containing protein n=1 Tax=Paenibacillus sp. ClWae2A TaxID=3057177 RepID=UPI0028F4F57C|nr:right-handed parallel beta-helix repeat-containing protein [Paenibacillus sp. ClWae2A]MDT9718091.1 right-handed parallel beta-helix repeat-containing protein [Paenibacillus sp. ClWae2A]